VLFGIWTTHTALEQSQMAGQDAELEKLASITPLFVTDLKYIENKKLSKFKGF